MKYQPFLIADSGGTKTDWCFVDEGGKRKYFTTASFHPSQWSDSFVDFFNDFWKNENIPYHTTVCFFGAGCNTELNQKKISLIFNKWGFLNVRVESDLLGAGKALFQDNPGSFAIMGTGSVFCKYNGHKIDSHHGGLGYLIGDEGSGYYFGVLLLRALLNGELEDELSDRIYKTIGTRNQILKKVYSKESKSFMSSIALSLKNLKEESKITKIHKNNFKEFVNRYIVSNNISSISIVGSYAYYHQDILLSVLNEYNIIVNEILHYPIAKLTDCLLRDAV